MTIRKNNRIIEFITIYECRKTASVLILVFGMKLIILYKNFLRLKLS